MATEIELKGIAADIVASDARALRRSAIYGLVAFAAGVAWIVYAYRQVQHLGTEAVALERRLGAQTQQLRDQEAALAKQQAQIRDGQQLLLELDPLLREFGWSPGRLTHAQATSPEIRESLRANRALSEATASSKRGSVHVFYFPKDEDADPQRVIAALRQLDFDVRAGTARNRQKTNSIVFGSAVAPEDAKIVALALVRAGVPVKAMYRTTAQARLDGVDRAHVIQVLGYAGADELSPLTVDEIQRKSEFPSIPIRAGLVTGG